LADAEALKKQELERKAKLESDKKGSILIVFYLFNFLAAETKPVGQEVKPAEKPMTELEKSKQDKLKLKGLNYILF
jgi:hypothetical protein